MEAVIGYIIQLIGGAVGGYGTGRVAKNVSISPTVDAIVGLIGGFVGTWISSKIPGLDALVANGGAGYIGQAATGLVGGGILTAIVGFIKNMSAKRA